MMTYILGLLVFLNAFGPTYAQEVQASSPVPLTLDYHTFVDLVEKNHPEQSLNQLAISRALEAEKKAGVLMDPELSIAREEIPLRSNGMGSNMSGSGPMWKLNLTQTFPWPGTLAAEEAAAKASTDKAQAEVRLSTAQRVLDAKDFFIRLIAISKIAEVQRESLNESTMVLKNAETRLRHGTGSHHDLIQAENEKVVLSLNLSALEADIQNLKDYVAQLVGRDDATGVKFVMDYPASYVTKSSANETGPKIENLKKRELEAARHEASMMLEAERKKSLPSFMATGMLMEEDSGMRTYGFMAGIKVPLYSGTVRKAVESEKAIVSSQSSEELAWHEKRRHLASLQNKRRHEAVSANVQGLKNEIVPNSKQHLQSLAIEYGQGKGSFAGVNTARKLLLRYQLAQVMAERDLALVGISREKIEAGLIDPEINQTTPQLPTAEMTSGMEVSGTQGMPEKNGSMSRKVPMDRKPMSKPNMQPQGEDEPASKGTGSMEGM